MRVYGRHQNRTYFRFAPKSFESFVEIYALRRHVIIQIKHIVFVGWGMDGGEGDVSGGFSEEKRRSRP